MDLSFDFHKDHTEWKSKLDFYSDEIKFFFKELNKVFDKHKENLAWMELIDEYEAILDKKTARIEELSARIQKVEKECTQKDIEKSTAKAHRQLHLDFIEFDDKFVEMKKRFKRFASHND